MPGIVLTGAFAVGAGVAGSLALAKNNELAEMRKITTTTTKTELTKAAESASARALVSDLFLGAAVASGVVTLIVALKGPSAEPAPDKPAEAAPAAAFLKDVKFDVSPTGVVVRGRF